MRELYEVEPIAHTEVEILRHGLQELSVLAPGNHQTDPCYGALQEIKDYSQRICEAANHARLFGEGARQNESVKSSGEGPRCTCERGADLDHWSRCDVHRVERSYTAPLNDA